MSFGSKEKVHSHYCSQSVHKNFEPLDSSQRYNNKSSLTLDVSSSQCNSVSAPVTPIAISAHGIGRSPVSPRLKTVLKGQNKKSSLGYQLKTRNWNRSSNNVRSRVPNNAVNCNQNRVDNLNYLNIPRGKFFSSLPGDVDKSAEILTPRGQEKIATICSNTSKIHISSTDAPDIRHFLRRSEAATTSFYTRQIHSPRPRKSSNDSSLEVSFLDPPNEEVKLVHTSETVTQNGTSIKSRPKPESKMTSLERSFSNFFDKPDLESEKFFKGLEIPESPKREIKSLRLVRIPSKKPLPRTSSPSSSPTTLENDHNTNESPDKKQQEYRKVRPGFSSIDLQRSNFGTISLKKTKRPFLLDCRLEPTRFFRRVSKSPGSQRNATNFNLFGQPNSNEGVEGRTFYYSSNLNFQDFTFVTSKTVQESTALDPDVFHKNKRESEKLKKFWSMEILGNGRSFKDPETRRVKSCGILTSHL